MKPTHKLIMLAAAVLLAAAPAPVREYQILVGQAVDGLPGVTIKTLSQPLALPSFGLLFHAKLAGTGVDSTNSEALMLHFAGFTQAILRSGTVVNGVHVKSLGDPTLSLGGSNQILVQARMVRESGIDATNDQWVLTVPFPSGTPSVVAQTGQIYPNSGGRAIVKFLWMHPSSSAIYFGVMLDTTPTTGKVMGIINPSTGTVAIQGGPVTVSGVTETIKTIAKPFQKGLAVNSASFFDSDGVTVLLKTVEGHTLINQYP
jgi:hypothetical protein